MAGAFGTAGASTGAVTDERREFVRKEICRFTRKHRLLGDTPSFFVVYAHDASSPDAPLAHANNVKQTIKWLQDTGVDVHSDQWSHGRNHPKDSDFAGVHNIVDNQLQLLPPGLGRRASVKHVLVYGSLLLQSYCEHPLGKPYIDSIKEAYKLEFWSDRQEGIKNIVEQHAPLPGFHHILIELALLEIRGLEKPGNHDIIQISLDGSTMDYLGLPQTEVRLKSTAALEDLHKNFFKILKRIAPFWQSLIVDLQTYYDEAIKYNWDAQTLRSRLEEAKEDWKEREQEQESKGKVDTSCHFVGVPLPEPSFVGRGHEIEKVKQRMFATRDDQRTVSAIQGLGGMGKTQVALQIAQYVHKELEWSVFWISGANMAAFEKGCADTLREVGKPVGPGQDSRPIFQAYLESEKSRQWLLVIDNVDDLKVAVGQEASGGAETELPGIRDFLPRAYGHVLFTTRLRTIAEAVTTVEYTTLQPMTQEEGKELLHKVCKEEVEEASESQISDLLDLLTYLPLAILQAGKYLCHNFCTVAEYVEQFQATTDDAIELLSEGYLDHQTKTKRAIATTWMITFEHLKKEHPDAVQLLCFISQVEPRAIPKSMLSLTDDKRRDGKAMAELRGFAFLSRRADSKLLDMHSLVHLSAQAWVKKEGLWSETRLGAAEHLSKGLPDLFSLDARPEWYPLLPHILKLCRRREANRQEEPFVINSLKTMAGRFLVFEGRGSEVVDVLEQVVQDWQHFRGSKDERWLQWAQSRLGQAHYLNGSLRDAIPLLEEVMDFFAEQAPDNVLVEIQKDLGTAYMADEQFERAILVLEKAINVWPGDDPVGRLQAEFQLARCRRYSPQTRAQGLQDLKRLEDATAKLDVLDILRLTVRRDIAWEQIVNGEYEGYPDHETGLKEFVKIMKLHQELFKDDTHPDRVAIERTLAGVYWQVGDRREAEEDKYRNKRDAVKQLKEVTHKRGKTLPKDHPDLVEDNKLLKEWEEWLASHPLAQS